jgi:hypothetical protein
MYYLSTVNLHEDLKYVNLLSNYRLAVKHMNSKHDSCLVMNTNFSN